MAVMPTAKANVVRTEFRSDRAGRHSTPMCPEPLSGPTPMRKQGGSFVMPVAQIRIRSTSSSDTASLRRS